MKEYFEEQINIIEKESDKNIFYNQFSENKASCAIKFHKSLPQYKETSLISLECCAKKI